MIIIVFPVIDIKEVKSLKDLIGDFFITGQKKMIGIDPGSIFVEISCANYCKAFNELFFCPGDKA